MLLAGVLGGGYMGFIYVPLWVDNLSLKRIMREEAAMAWRYADDEALRKTIFEKSKQIGGHNEVVQGQQRWVPSVVLLLDDIYINRDNDRKMVTIQVEYDREVVYPWIGRKVTVHFAPVVTDSLEQVTW